MTTTATQRMTAEEFFEWVHRPENAGRHFELERGEVVEVGRPGERHGVVCSNVTYELGRYIRQQRRGYTCCNDTGVLWEDNPDTVRGPDVFYYDVQRRYTDLTPRYSDEVPTLVVEVLSPNDKPGRVNVRTAEFLTWGVRLVWVVDPEDRTVVAYRPKATPEIFRAGQEIVCEDVLPSFRCRVDDLFFLPGEEPPPATS